MADMMATFCEKINVSSMFLIRVKKLDKMYNDTWRGICQITILEER